MLKEFKDFIIKGNAIDLAVGVLIGAAFGKVVSAITDGVINPILNSLGGNPNISLKLWVLDVGMVINAVLALLITGAVLFFVFVKPMNKLKALAEKPKAPEAPAAPPAQEVLLAEIRDLLKNK